MIGDIKETVKNNIWGFYKGKLSNWYGSFKNQESAIKIDNDEWFELFKMMRIGPNKIRYHQRFLDHFDASDKPFTLNFNCAEHAFMFGKAILFNDFEIADKILASTSASEQKDLGRQVKGFDQIEWDKVKFHLFYFVCLRKFQQNEDLKNHLLSTGKNIICECSPVDKVWGIGIALDNPIWENVENWQGENLLGEVLMRVRSKLRYG